MSRNTRLSPRTSPAHLGFIQICGDDGGKILNISESGLSFESFAPLGEFQTLQFWFSLNLRDRIEAMGQVVWLDPGTKIGGLRFVNPSDRLVEHIRCYAKQVRSPGISRRGALFADILAKQKIADAPRITPLTPHELRSPQHFDSTELISWQRHREVCRKRFVLGLVVGLFVASTVTVAAYRFWVLRSPVAAAAKLSEPSSLIVPSSADTHFSAPPVPQTVAPAPRRSSVTAARMRPTSVASESNAGQELAPFNSPQRESGAVPAVRRDAIPPAPNFPKKAASSQQLWSAVQVGDTNAAVVLADRYLRGDGVPANCLQARVLLLVASEKKNADAIRKLGELDKAGCPADPKQ
ncbi:MAG TPA: PilZ domain-containing protein [Candidatus Acidoferrum sp.]|nr:PilZ domain-containing protein [Candidatus Acidoferrum sp.]